MIELPEAVTLARQVNEMSGGKRIAKVVAAHSPHKFAWYYEDPQDYQHLLAGKTIGRAAGRGGMVEIRAEDAVILFNDGVALRYHRAGEARPAKHQLLLEFDDATAISATVQMYGGLCCFPEGAYDNPYYKVAQEKPSPLTEDFNPTYFERMLTAPETSKLSAKAFLATEQRIPGLGNGVLQEILWQARLHPKRKMNTLDDGERQVLFRAVKSVLAKMAELGGRDTERDLLGNQGGYRTAMSKNTVGLPCPACSGLIKKESYLGGSVYFCEKCQAVS